MAGINKVILIGNLGKDPEVRDLENGSKVAGFRIATTESYKDRTTGERKDITDWHNIVMWNGLAGIAQQYLSKGSQVYIEGKLKTRQWQDKEGNTRYTTEVLADNMTMLGGRPGGNRPGAAPMPTEQPAEKSMSPDRGSVSSNTSINQPDTQAPAEAPEQPPAEAEDDLPF